MDENENENIVNVLLSRFANAIMASLLWILFCIPVFTIGPSTAALYNTAHRCICNDRDTVWNSFWETFKGRFKICVKYAFFFLLLVAFFFLDWCVTYVLKRSGNPLGTLNTLCIVMLVIVALWAIFLFSYLARFPKDKKHIIKNSFFMLAAHLPQAVIIVLAVALGVVLILWRTLFLFVVPGLVAACCEKVIEPVFYKIMTPEERKHEEEEEELEEGL